MLKWPSRRVWMAWNSMEIKSHWPKFTLWWVINTGLMARQSLKFIADKNSWQSWAVRIQRTQITFKIMTQNVWCFLPFSFYRRIMRFKSNTRIDWLSLLYFMKFCTKKAALLLLFTCQYMIPLCFQFTTICTRMSKWNVKKHFPGERWAEKKLLCWIILAT